MGTRRARGRRAIVVGAAVAACGGTYGADPPATAPKTTTDQGDGSAPAGDASSTTDDGGTSLPECRAQRIVHLVGGGGGLAWFTLLWPVPSVIGSFDPAYAYDDPTLAAPAPGTSTAHPLYARKVQGDVLWAKTGTHATPTVLVSGTNQTHTSSPNTTTMGAHEIVAAGAAAQKALAAPVPALRFALRALRYGPAPDAPAIRDVANVDEAVEAIAEVKTLTDAQRAELGPAAGDLDAWTGAAAPKSVVDLATLLYFTAAAFRHGLVGTVVMPALGGTDPHGAFADGAATLHADALARVLHTFYEELNKTTEPACSHDGAAVSLADNVLLLVSGDTPKNPFVRDAWPDGSPGGANWIYARANGYLVPGWFGQVTPSGKTDFNPTTGALDPATSADDAKRASLAGILFAMTRGDAAYVASLDGGSYQGLVPSTLP
ncbi:MAG: hypothetical protein KF782_23170 [Labilithrix sp.]|nr:hypothetical protein [Labilithrix sp.]